MLQDIAILTGAQVISEEVGLKLENHGRLLGRARKVVVTKDETTIVRVRATRSHPGSREARSAEIENTDSDYDREKLQERLAKLAGGVAVIKVGAATEVNSRSASTASRTPCRNAKAAVEEGIVAGGGVALIQADEGWPTQARGLTRQTGERTSSACSVGTAEADRRERGPRGLGVVVREGARLKAGEGLNAPRRVRRHARARHHRPGEGDAFCSAERGVDREASSSPPRRGRGQAGARTGDAGGRRSSMGGMDF